MDQISQQELKLSSEPVHAASDKRAKSGGWLAAGALGAAALASSCCILPLLLVTLGVGGAWIGNFTALEPYKPYFLILTFAALAGGFWHVYFRRKKPCAEDSYCARPANGRITKTVLWSASVLALLTATIDLWAPYLY